MPDAVQRKLRKLKDVFSQFERAAVAFSGGVDSTLVAAVAAEIIGRDNVLLVMVNTPLVPEWEVEEASQLAEALGLTLSNIVLQVDDIECIAHNPPDRCYQCKKSVFGAISAEARLNGIHIILDGTNADDAGSDRPGLKALAELEVASPLAQAGLSKADIREISGILGLPTASKPAYACLATRIPYGADLTPERLKRIEAAETALRSIFPGGTRVRDYEVDGKEGRLLLARVEIPNDDLATATEEPLRSSIIDLLHEVGYDYITLDLEALRSGSMDLASKTS